MAPAVGLKKARIKACRSLRRADIARRRNKGEEQGLCKRVCGGRFETALQACRAECPCIRRQIYFGEAAAKAGVLETEIVIWDDQPNFA